MKRRFGAARWVALAAIIGLSSACSHVTGGSSPSIVAIGGTSSPTPEPYCRRYPLGPREAAEYRYRRCLEVLQRSRAAAEAARSPEAEATPSSSSVPMQTFTFPEDGFAIDVPATWHSWSATPGMFGEISLTGPGMAIVIRPSLGDGWMGFLQAPRMPRTVAVGSVHDVVAHLVDEYQLRTALRRSKVRFEETRTVLGGDAASLVVVGPSATVALGPAPESYVVAFHRGKPVLVHWRGTRDKADLFLEIVATFRFLD
jgi:hypothetical protein